SVERVIGFGSRGSSLAVFLQTSSPAGHTRRTRCSAGRRASSLDSSLEWRAEDIPRSSSGGVESRTALPDRSGDRSEDFARQVLATRKIEREGRVHEKRNPHPVTSLTWLGVPLCEALYVILNNQGNTLM